MLGIGNLKDLASAVESVKGLIASGGDAEVISRLLNGVLKNNNCKGVIILLNEKSEKQSDSLVLPIPSDFDFENDIENLELFQDEKLGNFEKLGDFYLRGK